MIKITSDFYAFYLFRIPYLCLLKTNNITETNIKPFKVLNMDKKIIERMVHSAHLDLTDEEFTVFGTELDKILDYFEILDDAPDGDWVGITPVEVFDILREDEPHMTYKAEDLLDDMRTYDGYIRGPRL